MPQMWCDTMRKVIHKLMGSMRKIFVAQVGGDATTHVELEEAQFNTDPVFQWGGGVMKRGGANSTASGQVENEALATR
jgi:hypothetical protein